MMTHEQEWSPYCCNRGAPSHPECAMLKIGLIIAIDVCELDGLTACNGQNIFFAI